MKRDKRKKKEKETKSKKKKALIIIGIIILILLITGGIVGKLQYDKTLKNIKNKYNQYVITTKKTNLYNKKQEIVGTISKNITVELSPTKIKDISNQYFNIKDTDYYVHYKTIKKGKEIEKQENKTNYLIFNKNIKTTKETTLYKETKEFATIKNELNIPIEYMDENYYYVSFLNNLVQVKKDESIIEEEQQNTEEKESEKISILYYEKIDNNCSDVNCTTGENAKTQLQKLQEDGYYTINLEEYKNYRNSYIRLKEKALLITTDNPNEVTDNIQKELNITIEKIEDETLNFNSTNKPSSKEDEATQINRYQIKSYSTIENIEKMANQEEVIETNPYVNKEQSIAVLNYHFFYDPELGEACDEGICLTVSKFRQHLEYLKNNNYKAVTMEEFKKWMYGEIELPTKSVLITIDDGAMGTGAHNGNKLIPLLEEYQLHATLFLIAGWWDIGNYQSPYLTIQSHTYDMHQYGSCGRGQLNCATYEQAKEDLQKSIDIIGNTDSFCFPFYYYSDTSIQAVKDSGFKLAFVGGNRKANRKNNKYLIPRYPIHSDITLERFIDIVS